jgi:uncharacterized protein YndB with AHSA1/START domain
MEKITVERSIWIGAPRERVWLAITDPQQLEQWLLPPALGGRVKRDDADKVFICLGDMNIEVAIFEGIDPPRQVTNRALPDGLITATYALEEENDGTRITVRLTGFEGFAEDARQDRLAPTGAGWEKGLKNLKAFVDGKALPFPEGYVAALFGYRRETKEKFAIERSIWINAPQEKVWQAITDPQEVVKWFSPGTEWQGTGLKVGGRFYVPNPETGAEMYTQIIEVVEPPRQFVTRTLPDAGDFPTVSTWTLTEEKGGTRLTLVHSGYELMPDNTRHDPMEQNAFGFGMMLANIKAHIEEQILPYPGGF